jgi:hypothetical protein
LPNSFSSRIDYVQEPPPDASGKFAGAAKGKDIQDKTRLSGLPPQCPVSPFCHVCPFKTIENNRQQGIFGTK